MALGCGGISLYLEVVKISAQSGSAQCGQVIPVLGYHLINSDPTRNLNFIKKYYIIYFILNIYICLTHLLHICKVLNI